MKKAPKTRTKRPAKAVQTKSKKATKKSSKPVKKQEVAASGPTKGEMILALVARDGGATLAELQTAAGWQAHSVRGFLSTMKKKGHKVFSSRSAEGARLYELEAAS